MNLYIGQIEKAKFYDARITNGQFEPTDSQMFKIAHQQTCNENKWLKDLTVLKK